MLDWKVLDSGALSAAENMEMDSRLLHAMQPEDPPLLRLYEWIGPCATYGYFINPDQFFASDTNLSIARRPTGGGIIFHLFDLTFSVFIPALHPSYTTHTMDTYHFVNERVRLALAPLLSEVSTLLPHEPEPENPHCTHFCMAKPTRYDIVIGGKKIGGGAQRRTKNGVLHQGSIALFPLSEESISRYLLPHIAVWEAMQKNSFFLHKKNPPLSQLSELRKQICLLLVKSITE